MTGAHAFKVGFFDLWGKREVTILDNDSSLSYRFNNGVPNQITQRATPSAQFDNMKAEMGVFAQDKWTIKRLTLNAGVRFDYFATGFPGTAPRTGAAHSDAEHHVPRDRLVRLQGHHAAGGRAYDLFGNGKTALKVNVAKYVARPPTPPWATRCRTSPFRVTRSWTDANRDFVPDCDLLNPHC